MGRTTTTWSITVPDPLAREVERFVNKQKRTKSELISEALRQYLVLWGRRERRFPVKKPQKVPKDQEWFWTPEWQEKEREADEAIHKGEVSGPFSTAEELIEHLKHAKA